MTDTNTDDTEAAAPPPTVSLPAEIVRVGNLIRSPEINVTPSNQAVAKTSLAFTPYDRDTKTDGDTVFYTLNIWGALGENAAACLQKGDRVIVVGRPKIREWTGRDGVTRSQKEIDVDAIGPDIRFKTATVDRLATAVNAGPLGAPLFEEPF